MSQLTSAERRGIAAVAAAALLCIGAGLLVRRFSAVTQPTAATPPTPELLTPGQHTINHSDTTPSRTDTISATTSHKTTSPKKAKQKKSKSRKTKNKNSKPQATPRNPLDDPIPTN